MSDLDSRLLAAVTRNAKSRCYGVTAINSLQNSGVTLSPLVTPELSRKISPVTPLHPKSAGWEGQEKDSTKPKGNPAQAESDTWTNVAEE